MGWRRQLKRLGVIVVVVAVIPLNILRVYIAQPTFSKNEPSSKTVDAERLKQHVRMLSETFHPSHYNAFAQLNQTADYIAASFEEAGAEVRFQEYLVYGKPYKNVIGRFHGEGPLWVVGAHYDTSDDTPGADDNASGVAGLLELASLIGAGELKNRNIELVAYCLEEPPYFATEMMGSAFHVKELQERGEMPAGVVIFEMIGYFSDAWGSQGYPALGIRLMYPQKGNYIAVIGKLDQRAFTKSFKVGMKGATDLPVYSMNAPKIIPGIDFSDHRNYWPLGINAVMITDTAFYRNKAYHGPDDTWDRLDYDRMAMVVVGVYEALAKLAVAYPGKTPDEPE
jgi:hypothetical protein